MNTWKLCLTLEVTYDKWSGNYEQDMATLGYPGPAKVARIVR